MGLGELKVFSALGEPLNAEIELLSASPEELASLTVSLASKDIYASQGIDKTAIQQNIKASISKKSNQSNVIKLSTSQAVTDPFLDMLIQVSWNEGLLYREYTLLLDPPNYSVATVVPPVAEQSKVSPSKPDNKSDSKRESKPESKKANSTPNPTNINSAFGETSPSDETQNLFVPEPEKTRKDSDAHRKSITTVKGDSLSGIAKAIQVEDVSLDQMLIGLYAANPSAFEDKNMNRLKVGQLIRVPSQEALKSVSQQEARREVRAQVASWQSYTGKLAELASKTVPADQGANQQNSGKIISKAEDKAAPEASGTHDVVKLAKTEQAKPAGADQADATNLKKDTEQEKNKLNDDLAANENAIKETDERSAALEKQIADMKNLVAIKNKSMAEAQKNAEQAKQKDDEGFAILEVLDPTVLSVLGASLVLLLLLGLWKAKNRRQLQSSLNEEPSANNNSFSDFINEIGAPVPPFQADFLPESASIVDTHEVDPIAEADVFLAYGRHAQAEDILKEAILKNPERYELHMKLLRIYAENRNIPAFELLAVELFSQLGSNDANWAEVSALGLTIDPDNKLYHRGKEKNALPEQTPDNFGISDYADAALMEDPYEANALLGESNLSANNDGYLAEVEEIIFDVPEQTAVPVAELSPLKDNVIDLTDINLTFEAIKIEPLDLPRGAIPDAFSGDFSNLLKADPKLVTATSNQLNDDVSEVENIEFEKSEFEKSQAEKIDIDFAESEDVTTKLELASAYIDMADKEGALELLAEALKEGGPQQRQRAQAMIDSLA
jgi:pilus assembly protein FimV